MRHVLKPRKNSIYAVGLVSIGAPLAYYGLLIEGRVNTTVQKSEAGTPPLTLLLLRT